MAGVGLHLGGFQSGLSTCLPSRVVAGLVPATSIVDARCDERVFGEEDAQVGATCFTLPDTVCGQGGAAFRIRTSSKAAGRRRSVEGRAWHAPYALFLPYRMADARLSASLPCSTVRFLPTHAGPAVLPDRNRSLPLCTEFTKLAAGAASAGNVMFSDLRRASAPPGA